MVLPMRIGMTMILPVALIGIEKLKLKRQKMNLAMIRATTKTSPAAFDLLKMTGHDFFRTAG